jgi:hypothetical protein
MEVTFFPSAAFDPAIHTGDFGEYTIVLHSTLSPVSCFA